MWKTHVDPKTLAAYKANKLLKSQNHPRLPLTIWNYAPECQYNKDKWDEITTLCRGLIVDSETNEIVGRSFRKFWNEGEKLYTPTETFSVWEKMDGSLGILFNYKGQWIITSRGSFTSDQAIKAQQMIQTKYDISNLDPNTSYVFEIIYPENRIVIDYGEEEALYFLAAFKRSGEEIYPPPVDQISAAGFPICRSYPEFASDYSKLHNLDWSNHEGFVIRFSTGERMKIKFENYLELHRMATNLSTTSVYEWFCDKKPLADLLAISPDEFHDWIKSQWDTLQSTYSTLLLTLNQTVEENKGLSQKEFAQKIVEHPHRPILFSIRVGKDPFDSICKAIKPEKEERLDWGKRSDDKRSDKQSDNRSTSTSKRTNKATILVGISGSGKSTYAKQMLNTTPNTVVISRDKIREQLFAYDPHEISRYYESPHLAKKEELVSSTELAQLEAAFAANYDVIIDDTNLTQKVIKTFMTHFPDVEFHYKVFDCTVEEAIQRISTRDRKVSDDVLRAQHTKFKTLLPYLEDLFLQNKQKNKLEQNDALDSAIVVDLDGTLAIHTGRSPYDWSRVEEDYVNKPVFLTVDAMRRNGFKIILCSGRSEEAREGTERWLKHYDVNYESLHMRRHDDQRPDFIVKEEIWAQLVKQYNIVYMLDDRDSVVKHARRLGFTVFQVAPGNF